jgi:hypothetical protein
MTIQSIMNKRVRRGMAPSEWAINLSNKNHKINKQKSDGSYQLPSSYANTAKYLYHRAGLSIALAPENSEPEIARSHNQSENVSNFKN